MHKHKGRFQYLAESGLYLMIMVKVKRARTAETLKQPSLCLWLRAPYFYPDSIALPYDPLRLLICFDKRPCFLIGDACWLDIAH
jgi:hypothetical protein